jgi:hypothetical protein
MKPRIVFLIVAGLLILAWVAFRYGMESEEPSPPVAVGERAPGPETSAGEVPRLPTSTPSRSGPVAREADPRTPEPPASAAAGHPAGGRSPGAIEPSEPELPPDEEPPDDVLYTPDGDGIPQAVRDHIGEMKDCYEAWLAANPGLEGKIVVDFIIEQDPDDTDAGRVRDLSVDESTVDHLMLEGCVGSVFEGLAFEAPSEEVHVTGYPLIFSTTGPEDEAP